MIKYFKRLQAHYKNLKQERKRCAIEMKYQLLFESLDLDFNGYLALQRVKNDELAANNL